MISKKQKAKKQVEQTLLEDKKAVLKVELEQIENLISKRYQDIGRKIELGYLGNLNRGENGTPGVLLLRTLIYPEFCLRFPNREEEIKWIEKKELLDSVRERNFHLDFNTGEILTRADSAYPFIRKAKK